MSIEAIKEIIHQAGNQLITIEFSYTDKDGNIKKSIEVEPYNYRFQRGNTLFFGFDIKKNGIRAFYPHKIDNIRLTGNKFIPRWQIEV